MCDFCNGKNWLINNEGANVIIEDDKLILTNDVYSSGTIKTESKINYCPICGRGLRILGK